MKKNVVGQETAPCGGVDVGPSLCGMTSTQINHILGERGLKAWGGRFQPHADLILGSPRGKAGGLNMSLGLPGLQVGEWEYRATLRQREGPQGTLTPSHLAVSQGVEQRHRSWCDSQGVNGEQQCKKQPLSPRRWGYRCCCHPLKLPNPSSDWVRGQVPREGKRQ